MGSPYLSYEELGNVHWRAFLRLHSDFNPLEDVLLPTEPVGSLSADGNISHKERREKESGLPLTLT